MSQGPTATRESTPMLPNLKRVCLTLFLACTIFLGLLAYPRFQEFRAERQYAQVLQNALASASRKQGAAAVPELIFVLVAARTEFTEANVIGQIHWRLSGLEGQPFEFSLSQIQAAGRLQAMGSNACSATPALLRMLEKDADLARFSIDVITQAGCDTPEVIAALVKMAADEKNKNTSTAIIALVSLGERDPSAMLGQIKSLSPPPEVMEKIYMYFKSAALNKKP